MQELTWNLGIARAQLCPFFGRRCGLRGPGQGRRAMPVSEAVVEIERQGLLAEIAPRKWNVFKEGCVIFKLRTAVVFFQKKVKEPMAEEEITASNLSFRISRISARYLSVLASEIIAAPAY